MKVFYYVCAGLCALLAVCAVLSMMGVLSLELDLKDAVIGVLGTGVGGFLGYQVGKDEKRQGGGPLL